MFYVVFIIQIIVPIKIGRYFDVVTGSYNECSAHRELDSDGRLLPDDNFDSDNSTFNVTDTNYAAVSDDINIQRATTDIE
jgi:hypothetical protein